MYYPRYFKLGQPISLKRLFLDPNRQNQTDILSGQIASCTESKIVVHFPYGFAGAENNYPFFPGMPFEIHTEYHGIGVRVPVTFEDRLASGLIELLPAGNLAFYYLREHPRHTVKVWFGITRNNLPLLSMRRQWRRHIDKFLRGEAPSADIPFARQKIKLGNDSIEMDLEAPVKTSELVMVFLALDDGKPVVCILAEVVDAEEPTEDNRQKATLHFINILEEDRGRICKVLRTSS